MKAHKRYPSITKAALEIARDNGCIFRDRSERSFLRSLDEFLERQEIDVRPISD